MKHFFCLSLFGIGLIIGCRSYSEEVIGNYQSKRHNLITKEYLSYFKNTTFVIGSTLEIKTDSTYYLENCGNIEEGKWRVHNDSLLLFCKNNRWRIDSLNKTGFNDKFLDCGDGTPSVFIISNNVLKQQWKSKGRTVLNYFEKNE